MHTTGRAQLAQSLDSVQPSKDAKVCQFALNLLGAIDAAPKLMRGLNCYQQAPIWSLRGGSTLLTQEHQPEVDYAD